MRRKRFDFGTERVLGSRIAHHDLMLNVFALEFIKLLRRPAAFGMTNDNVIHFVYTEKICLIVAKS